MSMDKKNFKKLTKMLTELTGEVNKIVGCKFNIYKLIVCNSNKN